MNMMRCAQIVAVVIGGILPITPAEAVATKSSCILTVADKVANAKLSFDDFDQKGVTPATFRQLANRGCIAQAVEAAEDYLVHGALKNPREQRDVQFHLGQVEALLGNERVAAKLIAGAKDPAQPPGAKMDWNTYVEGTWAFLVKDRAKLEAAHDKLNSEPGMENKINAGALAGLVKCYGLPYAKAISTECRPN